MVYARQFGGNLVLKTKFHISPPVSPRPQTLPLTRCSHFVLIAQNGSFEWECTWLQCCLAVRTNRRLRSLLCSKQRSTKRSRFAEEICGRRCAPRLLPMPIW